VAIEDRAFAERDAARNAAGVGRAGGVWRVLCAGRVLDDSLSFLDGCIFGIYDLLFDIIFEINFYYIAILCTFESIIDQLFYIH